MSSTRRPAISWNKLLAIALFVLLVGYIVGRPTLERWWGIELPSLVETGSSPRPDEAGSKRDGGLAAEATERTAPPPDLAGNESAPPSAASQRSNSRPTGTPPAGATPAASGKAKDPFAVPPRTASKENTTPEREAKWELRTIDRGRLLSPAGLIYARGPQGEHRVDHVMRHAEDDPNRPQHGVFNGSRDDILQLLDEAYQLIQQNSKRVNKQAEGDRIEYTIRFDRPIGYEGGRSGKRNNNPQVNRLRLVLEDGKSVITAYPVR